jgi:hypothetical protein
MIDKDLDNQILVRLDDWTYNRIIGSINASQEFKAQIVRKCIMRCIRQDDAPRWKKIIRKILGL